MPLFEWIVPGNKCALVFPTKSEKQWHDGGYIHKIYSHKKPPTTVFEWISWMIKEELQTWKKRKRQRACRWSADSFIVISVYNCIESNWKYIFQFYLWLLPSLIVCLSFAHSLSLCLTFLETLYSHLLLLCEQSCINVVAATRQSTTNSTPTVPQLLESIFPRAVTVFRLRPRT